MPTVKGFFLLELIVVMFISSLMIGVMSVSFDAIDRLKVQYFAEELSSVLSLGRYFARAYHTRVYCRYENEQFILMTTDKRLYTLKVPEKVRCEMTRDLYFTEDGRSGRAGSIRIESGAQKRRVSLGVGYGRVNLW
ncbi:hypothetical protein DID77_02815 [Candidatus Marinamargulisbacteria bacterium SCGC AG-439-L15]|nr:hypothetical protein DID77_02815 [Candidatus Marinamargulisbacteria bacterium SCGC AG-439-L15]